MSLKVYEARSLIESMEDRAKEYSSLREKLVLLRKRFLDIVQLDDALKGKGANAIKGFYQAQIDVIDAWLRLVDRQIAFFKGVSGDAGDNDLSGNTVVYQSFLETELSHHEKNYMMMVDSQQDELKRIFNRVDDLVPLNVFSTDRFMDAVAEAKKGRNETIQAVENFDEKVKSEYTLSEDDEHYVVALFQQLLEATRQGNEILPIHFNAEQYQTSDVYLLKEQAEQQANDYLNFKEEQEKAREQMKRLEEQKQRPWYEKTWEGVKNFTGELTGYYDYIRASEGVDPVTGAELTTAQRVTAGAMAAAGFIPVVGWAGRIVKGGGAIYKTAKGMHAADQALDVYLNAKTFSNLEKAELGIYGLVSVNGFNEYILGKDMFGNELTDLQRQQSLYYSILGPALMATPFIPSLVKNGKAVSEETIGKLHQLTLKTKTGAISFGRELQGGMNVLLQNPRSNLPFSSIGNSPINVMNPMKILKDIDQGMSKFSFGDKRGSTKSVNTSNVLDGAETKGTAEVKTIVYSVENFLNEMNSLPHAKLSKEVTDGLISTPKGKRPLPEVYMTKKEISSHLALFDEGAVKIQSRESYEQATKLYGSNIGDPKTGTYVLPKNVVDKAVEASNGNPRVLEELLGLEKGYLGEKPIMLNISEFENIRVPSGNESGAWQGFWEPGGYTQGGIPEAVIDQIKSSNYKVSDIY